ncbi:MAG TPA: GtrA family protein [Candidatus Saccharimonadia bacterium]
MRNKRKTMPARKKSAKKDEAALAKQGGKFAVVGVSNTLIDFTIFQVVTTLLGVPPAQSYMVKFFSGSVAMINSFYWNRRWTFKSNAGLAQSGVKFLAATLVSVWAIQPGMVFLFSGTGPGVAFGAFWFHCFQVIGVAGLLPNTITYNWMIKTVAFGMGVVGSAIWNFTLYKLWAFKV